MIPIDLDIRTLRWVADQLDELAYKKGGLVIDGQIKLDKLLEGEEFGAVRMMRSVELRKAHAMMNKNQGAELFAKERARWLRSTATRISTRVKKMQFTISVKSSEIA